MAWSGKLWFITSDEKSIPNYCIKSIQTFQPYPESGSQVYKTFPCNCNVTSFYR